MAAAAAGARQGGARVREKREAGEEGGRPGRRGGASYPPRGGPGREGMAGEPRRRGGRGDSGATVATGKEKEF